MLKNHRIALVLICSVTSFASAVAAEESVFSVKEGAVSVWKDELPKRFLASFEFRKNSAAPSAVVSIDGDRLIEVPATDMWQSAQIAVNTESRIYSSWLGDKVVFEEKQIGAAKPEEVAGGGAITWQSDAQDGNKNYQLGGDFTIAAKFRTNGDGSIVAKCAPKGEWTPDSKALFIKGGRLIYDIGWLGAVKTGRKVNDGKWHHVVLVSGGGDVRIFVDGKLEVEKDGFTRPDPGGSVLKIGQAASNFGGDFKRGEIEFVRFWKRELPSEEIAALGNGNEAETNTPLLNWKRGGAQKEVPKNVSGGLRFAATGGQVDFRKVTVAPLAAVDHERLIRGWDHLSLERGARIYNGLCITCHGDQKVEGTLPTALRFHRGEFKNGKDPLAMYNTLSNGFNLMVAQPWMTPTQKYDVIHYIRETFLEKDNPKQFVPVDDDYLASLPRGIGVGPTEATLFADNDAPKYKKMNFGPVLFWTLEAEPGNIAYKGIAVRLDEGPGGVSKGNKWLLYDHDTMRVAAAWTGDEFVNWRGIAFDQSHGSHTAIVGEKAFTNPVGPGWGRPGDGSFEEVRFRGRDDKPYGPLPRDWAHYKGLYLHGNRAIVHYTVGDATVHELPGYEMLGDKTVFTRSLEIGKSSQDLKLRIAPEKTAVAKVGGGEITVEDGFHVLNIAAAMTPLAVKILTAAMDDATPLAEYAKTSGKPIKLQSLMGGSDKRWPGLIVTEGKMGGDEKAFEVDEVTLPWDDRSPWNSWMRLGGFDFFPDGKRAAVATWLGDVWIVDGLGGKFEKHNWQRIATGLFQPLGVKIVDGKIYVSCRDQIAELNDLNGDGETDYVRNFNNDHQVTEHFHEFAMGLQTDDEGNFYYAKSARHAKTALVAHHGTLLKVDKDGRETEIIATGFRAANGVCLNPDGSFIVTDQEGHWNPKNRINWVKKGGFYGNMFGYHDVTDDSDEAMEPPLCWITNKFDRSPGELMWVPQDAEWGGLNGSLLNLSYGTGRVFLVPHEKLDDGRVQGGMISIGLDFPTGTMRGRFHPGDGQLYTSGMFAWAGSKQQDGGLYRVRYTGKAANLPIGLKAVKGGMVLEFDQEIDAASAREAGNFKVKVWGLKRTKNYGSKHYDERELKIAGSELLAGGKGILIGLPGIEPTWCMEISYKLKNSLGQEFEGTIHNTVHELK